MSTGCGGYRNRTLCPSFEVEGGGGGGLLVPCAEVATRVRSGRFGDYIAGRGDDPDGGVFATATGSLGMVVCGVLGLPSFDGFGDGRRDFHGDRWL